MAERRVFRIAFIQQDQVFEVFARNVTQGNLFGFVEIEGLLFGEKTQLVVDPSEERLRTVFQGVRRVYVPLHAVIRIDEVEKQGVARILPREKGSGTLTPFPTPMPGKPSGSD